MSSRSALWPASIIAIVLRPNPFRPPAKSNCLTARASALAIAGRVIHDLGRHRLQAWRVAHSAAVCAKDCRGTVVPRPAGNARRWSYANNGRFGITKNENARDEASVISQFLYWGEFGYHKSPIHTRNVKAVLAGIRSA